MFTIAKKFNLPVEKVKEIYIELDISSSKKMKKQKPTKHNLAKVKKNIGYILPDVVVKRLEAKEKRKDKVVIKRHREEEEQPKAPIVRHPSVYTNSRSPFGLADELHGKKLIT